MNHSNSRRLAEKAEKAIIGAIEAYNRPDSPYREEAFAILALNAWELLVKSKLINEAKNDFRVLHVFEPKQLKDGSKSKRVYLKRNRAGNPYTLGFAQVIVALERDHSVLIPTPVKANLEALTEIRDNAIHYINSGPDLTKRVLEIGTATVKNFLELARLWFKLDLSRYKLYLLPIGFVTSPGTTHGVRVGVDEKRLIKYLSGIAEANQGKSGDFHAALEIAISLKRVTQPGAAQVQITRDPKAPKVQISEQDITKQYPWDYTELTKRVRDRYLNFKLTRAYHDFRNQLRSDSRYVMVRPLDPRNPKGTEKVFYNPNILDELDKLYTRK